MNQLFEDAIVEYFELFPFDPKDRSEAFYGFFFLSLFSGSPHERNEYYFNRAAGEGCIAPTDVNYLCSLAGISRDALLRCVLLVAVAGSSLHLRCDYTGHMKEANDIAATSEALKPRLRLHVLASGSKGNCSIIEDAATGECAAIDCGISWKAFRQRCESCGVDPMRVTSVLVTHEHTDHTKGLGVMTRGLARLGAAPAVYVSEAVRAASADLQAIQDAVDLRRFKAGDELRLGSMRAYAFRTSHDAAESFGFRFDCAGDALGFMTDTGVVTGEALEALGRCRVLAIEANHDPDMLAAGPYPAFLKARIAGERGHLSNAQSSELLGALLDDRLACVVGMHVSQNNNDYRLPKQALADVLVRYDHPATALVGFQDRPISR